MLQAGWAPLFPDPMDELAACLTEPPPASPIRIPRASALLAVLEDEVLPLPTAAIASKSPASSPSSSTSLLCPFPREAALGGDDALMPRVESAPSLKGSRLARAWLSGAAAFEGEDSPSMIDLQKLCESAALDDGSPSAVTSTLSFWDDDPVRSAPSAAR